jgi:hypothetical protein
LISRRPLATGGFESSVTNTPGVALSVKATTDVTLPSGSWTLLGRATEILPGQFQFTDPQATNYAQRFYRTFSP